MTISRNTEKGAALIAVLALIAVCTIIAGTTAILCQINRVEVDTHCKLGLSRYKAESAMTRIIWLTAADNSIFSSDSVTDYSEYDHDRYKPDGVVHTIDHKGTEIKFVIVDACTGLDLTSGAEGLNQLLTNRETDSAINERVMEFADKVTDYIDQDDTTSTDGMEKDDYEELNRYPLPRNKNPQYKEELLWLPEAEYFFPVDNYGRAVSLLPVQESLLASRDSRPYIYTATYTELITAGGFSPAEACDILDALERWKYEREPLEETLDGTLYMDLTQNFREEPSGAIRITIEQSAPAGEPGVKLSAVLQHPPAGVPENGKLAFWEWLWL